MASAFRKPKGLRGWDQLSPIVRKNYLTSLEVLNLARKDNLTMRQAAERTGGLGYETVMRYVGSATRAGAGGQRVPRDADRLFRPMEVVADGKRRMRAVYGSGSASDIGKHQAALSLFLDSGDAGFLAPFSGLRRAGVELDADPDLIEELARNGTLDDLEPYPRG